MIPTGPLFFPITLFPHLNYKDANFVDVIHSSNATYGYGINGSFGDVDFYPNGGAKQPQCDPMKTPLMLQYRTCNHDVSTTYFLQSINTTECLFRSVHCDSYDDFLNGQCPPEKATLNLMGLPAKNSWFTTEI
ncbi:lipase member I [Caerostris extrusa]|uniref:Lipase member I n=1 Tax=Caerostris extrusa TaxID=172846 RepID=A0AAV4MTX9_CAEEX|nr:lipase member I [Caerostris extrusa]